TAEVEHALDADHPPSGELVVAADLAAADKGRAVACAEIIVGNDRRAANLGDLGLFSTGPGAADVAAYIAARPIIGHDRSRHRRSLHGQVGCLSCTRTHRQQRTSSPSKMPFH